MNTWKKVIALLPWNWDQLHGLGTSRIVNSSWLWLVLIPVVSRILRSIDGAMVRGTEILKEADIDVIFHAPTLPLNFILFYFAAVFFAAAGALYFFFCPKLLKNAPNFGAFQTGHHSFHDLKVWFHDTFRQDRDRIVQFLREAGAPEFAVPNVHGNSEWTLADSDISTLMPIFWNYPERPQRISMVYDYAFNQTNKLRKWARVTALILYGIGFLVFGWVALSNAKIVLGEVLRSWQ